MRAAGDREYGPEGVGRRKSSMWVRLNMVFLMVRENGQKQGIWNGGRQEAKIIDLDKLRYGFPLGFVRAVRHRAYGIGKRKSSIWINLVMVLRTVRESDQKPEMQTLTKC